MSGFALPSSLNGSIFGPTLKLHLGDGFRVCSAFPALGFHLEDECRVFSAFLAKRFHLRADFKASSWGTTLGFALPSPL